MFVAHHLAHAITTPKELNAYGVLCEVVVGLSSTNVQLLSELHKKIRPS
jgi:hypothetical protein